MKTLDVRNDVRLTEKGIKLRNGLTVMHQRHAEMLSQAALSVDDLQATSVTLRRLERQCMERAVPNEIPLGYCANKLPT